MVFTIRLAPCVDEDLYTARGPPERDHLLAECEQPRRELDPRERVERHGDHGRLQESAPPARVCTSTRSAAWTIADTGVDSRVSTRSGRWIASSSERVPLRSVTRPRCTCKREASTRQLVPAAMASAPASVSVRALPTRARRLARRASAPRPSSSTRSATVSESMRASSDSCSDGSYGCEGTTDSRRRTGSNRALQWRRVRRRCPPAARRPPTSPPPRRPR